MSASRRTSMLAVSAVVVVAMSLVSCASITSLSPTQSPGSRLPTPRATSIPTAFVPPASLAPFATPVVRPTATGEAVVPPPIDQFGTPVQGTTTYGAPDWVKVGTRMTYYGAAATVVQSGYTYVEDPEGEWEDPKTGKRYHRTDQGDNPEDMPSAAGEAYTQTDVLAVEPGKVVLSTTMYPIDLMTRGFGINPLGGYNGQSAAVDGAWVHPSLLQDLVTSGYDDQLILRGPYTLGGKVYDTVSFLYRGPGSWQDSTYDGATGALLATNTRVEGNPSPVHGPFDDPQGNVQLSYTRLAGVRNVIVPGLGAPVPGWVAPSSTLTYSGSATVVNPMDPSAVFSWPVQATVTFGEVGATWATFTSHSVVDYGGYQQPTDSAGTTGSTGVYWYDPSSLATMQTGQVLDQDPITGASVTVDSADGGAVSLLTEMNGASLRLGYDSASGALVTMETTNSTTGITLQLQLTQG